MGAPSIGEELEAVGLQRGNDNIESYHSKVPGKFFSYEDIKTYPFDEDVGAVISGFDPTADYSRLSIASIYIQKCKNWIVTNEDAFTM